MPKLQSKIKPKSKTKLTSKAKVLAKSRPKTKVKAKPRLSAKLAIKSKSKLKAKKKTKILKPKKTLKSKTKPLSKQKLRKPLTPKKTVKKQVSKAKLKGKPRFNKAQKGTLLELIGKIVNLRRQDKYGLRSFEEFSEIMDKYNQHYTTAHQRFDAIVKIGMGHHAKSVAGLIALEDTGNDAVALYKLLAVIGKGKTKFSDAKNKLNSIYEESKEMHHFHQVQL